MFSVRIPESFTGFRVFDGVPLDLEKILRIFHWVLGLTEGVPLVSL